MIPLDQSPTKEVRTAPAENQPMQDSYGPSGSKTGKTPLSLHGRTVSFILSPNPKVISHSENRGDSYGIDFAFAARADDVTRTILLVAKKRAAAMNTFLLVRLSRIKRRVRSSRIARDSSFVGQALVVIRPIPIAAPFPNVAGHIVKPIAIRRK